MSTNPGIPGRGRQTAAEDALDANALELFARIAQAGSFAQAARDVGLTRAAISRRIGAIEGAVGLALFARSTRSLGLTEAGRRLLSRARAVREAAESARLALRHTRDQLDGTLRISATATFGQRVLAPLLAKFQLENRGVRFELFFTDRRVDLLREGLDVAFRLTSRPPQEFVAQPVLSFMVKAYRRAELGCLSTPTALETLPMLLFGQNEEPLNSQWMHEDGTRINVTLNAVAWGRNLDGLMEMARHSDAVVLAPDFCFGKSGGSRASPSEPIDMVDALPGWRFLAGIESVQALTLPLPAGSETARALVRFVRAQLAS